MPRAPSCRVRPLRRVPYLGVPPKQVQNRSKKREFLQFGPMFNLCQGEPQKHSFELVLGAAVHSDFPASVCDEKSFYKRLRKCTRADDCAQIAECDLKPHLRAPLWIFRKESKIKR